VAERHIIALGGGGFSVGESLAVDRYVLRQARREHPRVAFVGTASGDAEAYLERFMAAFAPLDCEPTHLPLFRRTPELRSFVLEQDVIYVGGGNTRSMLAVWREWGLPELLREAWEAGTVLAGISAGAICWFEQGVTDSGADALCAIECLGLLPGSCCPHYAGEPERRPGYRALLEDGRIGPGLAIDDAAAVHFAGDALRQVVCSQAGASAYRLELVDGAVSETELPAKLLEEPA
jgi:peptidase E